nr:hypothetical protein CFP56_52856 [Quercus suber]
MTELEQVATENNSRSDGFNHSEGTMLGGGDVQDLRSGDFGVVSAKSIWSPSCQQNERNDKDVRFGDVVVGWCQCRLASVSVGISVGWHQCRGQGVGVGSEQYLRRSVSVTNRLRSDCTVDKIVHRVLSSFPSRFWAGRLKEGVRGDLAEFMRSTDRRVVEASCSRNSGVAEEVGRGQVVAIVSVCPCERGGQAGVVLAGGSQVACSGPLASKQQVTRFSFSDNVGLALPQSVSETFFMDYLLRKEDTSWLKESKVCYEHQKALVGGGVRREHAHGCDVQARC